MKSYTVVSDGGGEGKTTIAAALAKAHELNGRKVLVIDMDGQVASISNYYGLDEEHRNKPLSLVDFLIRDERRIEWYMDTHGFDTEKEAFESLIVSREGIDFIPNNEDHGKLAKLIYQSRDSEVQKNKDERLRQVLGHYGVHENYDVLLIDPPASNGGNINLYNSVYAARNLLLVASAATKGEVGIPEIETVRDELEDVLEVDLATIGLVLNKYKENLNRSNEVVKQVNESALPNIPVQFGERAALFDGAWSHGVSPFTFHEEIRERGRTREEQTLDDILRLEEFIWARLNGASMPEAASLIGEEYEASPGEDDATVDTPTIAGGQ